MAESQAEMSFELLMQELQLGAEQVEGFIIEGMCVCGKVVWFINVGLRLLFSLHLIHYGGYVCVCVPDLT